MLRGIEEKLDNSIKDRKAITGDHETRIRTLEQRTCPHHDSLEGKYDGLKDAIGNINTDFKESRWKFIIAIMVASAVGSGGIDTLLSILFPK